MNCLLCDTPIESGQDRRPLYDQYGNRRYVHRECMLRNVLGGIGHLQNHDYWCLEMGDSDGGRSYRQSALEVDQWVHDHGIERAL